MRAAVLHAFGDDLVTEDVALANPKDHEVLVRIMATGVCQSDLTIARGKVRVALPIVLGHEAAGIVEAVGASVSKVKVGQRILLSWSPNCGHCFYCSRAHPTLCTVYVAAASAGSLLDGTSRMSQGKQRLHHYSCISAFAEMAVVPEAACIPLPYEIPFAVAALVGCAVTTGFGAVVNDAKARPGESLVVIGVGGVGVNAIQAAAVSGAEKIIAVDVNLTKNAVASRFGATHFVDACAPDAVEQIRSLTSGRGADSAIECTGNSSAMLLAYEATRPAGRVVIVGIAAAGVNFTVPGTGLAGSKKHIIGSIYGGGVPEKDIQQILALYLRRKLLLDEQIGARVPLDQINAAFRWLEEGVAGRTMISFDEPR